VNTALLEGLENALRMAKVARRQLAHSGAHLPRLKETLERLETALFNAWDDERRRLYGPHPVDYARLRDELREAIEADGTLIERAMFLGHPYTMRDDGTGVALTVELSTGLVKEPCKDYSHANERLRALVEADWLAGERREVEARR